MGDGTRSVRITDLIQRQPTGSRLMNVNIPMHQWEAIARLARQFRTSKTEIVVVLLKAGLEAVGRLRRSGALRRN